MQRELTFATKIRTNTAKTKNPITTATATTALVITAVVTTLLLLSSTITTVWADELVGTQEDDQILGTEGDDTILGLGGVDIIAGQGGNDILDGGNGDDSLFGGPGADEFVCGSGVDAVFDYNAEEGDTKSSDCEDVGFIRLMKAFGGTQQTPHDKSDFGVEVTGNNPVPAETGFTIAAVLPGQYSVHEIGESGGTLTLGDTVYEVTYSEGCSGTISAGETKVCTVTNSLN